MEPSIPRAVGDPRDPDSDPLETREWIEAHGRFNNPKRRQALLDRCAEAARTSERTP